MLLNFFNHFSLAPSNGLLLCNNFFVTQALLKNDKNVCQGLSRAPSNKFLLSNRWKAGAFRESEKSMSKHQSQFPELPITFE